MLTARVEPSLQGVRARLRPPERPGSYLAVLGAAAIAALSALVLASAVILGPPGLAHASESSAAQLP